MPCELLRGVMVRAGRQALEHAVNTFINNRGVSCFSEVNDDLLMWSHYGGRYRGFCLEFDTSYTPFEKITKVEYSSSLPEIDLMPMLLCDDFEQVTTLFSCKAAAWDYEREWRAVHQNAGTLYTYSAQSLTGVFFGPEISDSALEIICLILQGQNPDVRFWRGRRSPHEFKVEFEPFQYVPYVVARELRPQELAR